MTWGVRDAYLVPELAEASAKLCTNASVASIGDATHWVQYDARERVNELLLAFSNSLKINTGGDGGRNIFARWMPIPNL